MTLKMNIKYFQMQKYILQTGRAEKVHEKKGSFMFSSWVMILKLSKKVHFFSILY